MRDRGIFLLHKDQMKKALVCYVIEQTLVEMGGATMLNAVMTLLADKHQCEIIDCYDHPTYLSETMRHLFGNSYTKIIKSINEKLDEFAYQQPIHNFIEELRV